MSVENNVELRKKARELIELGGIMSPDFLRVLSDEALRMAGVSRDQHVAATAITAMSEDEAKVFDECVLHFGKHRGKKVSEVPLGYLSWCAENLRNDFSRRVNRYLMTPSVRRELESMESAE